MKRQVLKILQTLTIKTQGILLLLQSRPLLLSLLELLRLNCAFLKKELFEVLKNLKNQPHLYTFLAKFGFQTVFLEMVLKKEILEEEIRKEAFSFFLAFLEDKDLNVKDQSLKLLDGFPEEIRKKIWNVNEFLDSVDQEHESPFYEWLKKKYKPYFYLNFLIKLFYLSCSQN